MTLMQGMLPLMCNVTLKETRAKFRKMLQRMNRTATCHGDGDVVFRDCYNKKKEKDMCKKKFL